MTNKPLLRGLLALAGTGVLAGGAVFIGFVVGARVEGNGGEIGAVVALAGIAVCVALLAWAWWPLAPGSRAIWAAVATGVLSFLTTALAISLAAQPYDAIACADSSGEDFCGLGVLGFVPTVGAAVPWTVAGLPWLLLLVITSKRSRAGSRE
jgi:hypothetical protein